MTDQPAPGAQPHYIPTPSQPTRRARWAKYLIPTSCAVGCLPWIILFGLFLGALAGGGGDRVSSTHVAMIHVVGTISGGRSTSGFLEGATSGSEDVVDQLERARRNENAKAVVIRINSPGGSTAGSEEIYKAIRRLRGSGKPVYASMGDVAASGGYYIAAACDRIYADAGTITGSIGVIYSGADMSDLYRKIGFRPEVVKSGKFKDMGSPARQLTPEERSLIQSIVNESYEVFLKSVSRGRGIPLEKLRPIADGRVFTGTQAVRLKLVDRIGSLREVVDDAAHAGGISGRPRVVEYEHKGFLDRILGSETESSQIDRSMAGRLLEGLLKRNDGPQGLN